jgi:hypothetical protein
VGILLKDSVRKYLASDVVTACIERNKKNYYSLNNVEFNTINISDDALPKGDICIIRLVLQHLTNQQIVNCISKLSIYKHLIITEFFPSYQCQANIDQIAGAFSRRWRNPRSFIDISHAPFNYTYDSSEIIHRAMDPEGEIRTTVFQAQ